MTDTMTRKLVIASNNKGKIAELTELLSPLGLTPVAQGELGVPEAEEPAITFVENAILKARHAAKITGLPALADDSGLSVDALNGRPGVRSARFAGDAATDSENVQALLAAMKDTPEAQRKAQFHCVLVYLRHANDPTPGSSAMAAGRGRFCPNREGMVVLVTTLSFWCRSTAVVLRN